ncbi:hypothetical protein [Gemmatimonas aurantiaca]|uniref:hypothetical protein n=1 Tax=Gemmatimonas aurantiaca TaxID=173480 RepID=UPI00301D1FED
MHLHSLRLVRIVADHTVVDEIAALLAATGAHTCVYGQVTRAPDTETPEAALREWLVLIEALVSPSDAEAILRVVHDELQPRHAIIAYAVEAYAFLREQRL